MKLTLVRHGETDWNKLGKFQGQANIPLNQRGILQAKDTAKASLSWRPTVLYTSPLLRTMQVAEEISQVTGLNISTDARLMELHLGDMEGITGEEMRTKWDQVYQTWRDSPELVVMPGGESLVELQNRTWQAFCDLAGNASDDDNLVIVSHNFAIRAICGTLLGMPLTHFHRMYLNLGSITTMDRGQMGWRLLSYNSVAHLSPENRPD